MNGAAEFNQVYLNGVEVPGDAVLGEVNGGWAVAATLLGNERGLTGDDWLDADELVELAGHRGVRADPRVRQAIAEVYVGRELLRLLDLRIQQRMAAGQPIGSLASIVNLLLARHLGRSSEVASQLLGPALAASRPGDDPAAAWVFQVLTAPCLRIASGTDEIQRNILAERTLGLPREPQQARGTGR
jgi:alkylation response protein AidB-like acyl-CoA dehydrogenase